MVPVWAAPVRSIGEWRGRVERERRAVERGRVWVGFVQAGESEVVLLGDSVWGPGVGYGPIVVATQESEGVVPVWVGIWTGEFVNIEAG